MLISHGKKIPASGSNQQKLELVSDRDNRSSDDIIEEMESNVRSYSRSFPTTFQKANNEYVVDEDGREFIDLLAGAGALNYGHNSPTIKNAILEYVQDDGVIHALDMTTSEKKAFLAALHEIILQPRGLEYKVQFTGPTGANAVEAALKLARKAKERSGIFAFTGAFHGVSGGALGVTSNPYYKQITGLPISDVTFMPYENFVLGENAADSLEYLQTFLSNPSSGVPKPAAFIVETVQGEGGIRPASKSWLKELQVIARQHDVLLIIDDIQMGCGRTGSFFSFEDAGLEPDIVILSKSLSGYGLPLSLLLMRKELDCWLPGEHNGTFRGNNLALVAARSAIETFWSDGSFQKDVLSKSKLLSRHADEISSKINALYPNHDLVSRGRGMAYGIAFSDSHTAKRAARTMFDNGVLAETAGSNGEVLKFLPPLTISEKALDKAMAIASQAVLSAMQNQEHGAAV